MFDPSTGLWTITGSLSVGRSGHTATLLTNGLVLVAAGDGATNYLDATELYNPANETWTTTGPLLIPRDSLTTTATLLPNGKVLIAGGFYGPIGYLSESELYDSASGTWTNTGSLVTARESATATLLPNGQVLIAAGANGTYGRIPYAELYDPVSGTWTNTASLNFARMSHTATLLHNGKVLVVGGSGNGGYLSSVEFYDPAAGAWSATGSMSTGRTWFATTLLPNGQVLAAGGSGGYDSLFSGAELYDPASGIWRPTGSMSITRMFHTATLLPAGNVLVAGGKDSIVTDSNCAGAELYNPNSGTWTNTGSMTIPRAAHTATLLLNGQVLVAGGVAWWPAGVTNSAEVYDPSSGIWSGTGSMNIPRSYHTATLLPNATVLVTGGAGDGLGATAEIYYPATGTWTNTAWMSFARQYHTATLLPNGKVLVAGGAGTFADLPTAELYDPVSGTWTNTGSMNTARQEHTATLLPNGKVLVAGGLYYSAGNPVYLSSAELYDPMNGTWTTTGPMSTAHIDHRAVLLPSGNVLLAGGGGSNSLSGAELYDVGLGFSASSQPQVATFLPPLSLGSSLSLTGSQFRGISEGSGGNTQDSPADYPVVQLRAVESGQTLFLLPTSWSTNSYLSTPVTNFPPGYALATVFVNGIPSPSSILDIEDLSGFALTSILQQVNDIVLTWTTYAGKTNVVQVSPGAPDGSYTNNFTDLSLPIIVPGSGLVSTNWTDSNAVTNFARYYRVRLVP